MTGRVHVVGSANVDRTIPLSGMPGPGETVLGGAAVRGPGGKGLNQAVAAARLGAVTSFIGAVGEDPDGDLLVAVLEAEGIDLDRLARVDEPTGLAVVLVEPGGSNRIVVAPGANGQVDGRGLRCREGDVVVAQLEIPLASVTAALGDAQDAGAVTVLNAAPARTDLETVVSLVDVLVVNEPELTALAGVDPVDGGVPARLATDPAERDLSALAGAARRLPAGRGVVVTLGAFGALLVTAEEDRPIRGPSVDVVDTTGAGDCFVGALAAGLVKGDDLPQAAETAVEAASRSVTVAGAAPSMPRMDELAVWHSERARGG
jgi:ribokinase